MMLKPKFNYNLIIKLAKLKSLASLSLLTACSMVLNDPSVVSANPDLKNPPKLTQSNYQSLLSWDRPTAFGPVPRNLQSQGDLVCSILSQRLKAVGYNLNALDENNKTIPGGGYLCMNLKGV